MHIDWGQITGYSSAGGRLLVFPDRIGTIILYFFTFAFAGTSIVNAEQFLSGNKPGDWREHFQTTDVGELSLAT